MSILKLLLATPLMWIWYVLLAALVFLYRTRNDRGVRRGWHILAAGFLLLTLLSFAPLADALTQPLLRWYRAPSSEALAGIEAITVLGGGGREGVPSEATYERMTAGIQWFAQSGAKILAVQGAAEIDGEPTNAEIMEKMALKEGVPAEKIIVDSNSRTTAEHPSQLQALLPPDVTRIGIVTSALHMPRAVAVFQRYFPDKEIIPLPVGTAVQWPRYRPVDMVLSAGALSQTTAAIHEWMGMAWYWISGWR